MDFEGYLQKDTSLNNVSLMLFVFSQINASSLSVTSFLNKIVVCEIVIDLETF